VEEIAKLLAKKKIKRVPVIDEKGKLVGIVSRADIVKAFAGK
jgi:CBS domain-containing protein